MLIVLDVICIRRKLQYVESVIAMTNPLSSYQYARNRVDKTMEVVSVNYI